MNSDSLTGTPTLGGTGLLSPLSICLKGAQPHNTEGARRDVTEGYTILRGVGRHVWHDKCAMYTGLLSLGGKPAPLLSHFIYWELFKSLCNSFPCCFPLAFYHFLFFLLLGYIVWSRDGWITFGPFHFHTSSFINLLCSVSTLICIYIYLYLHNIFF